MATQDQINDLASLYAGYFNRAADPAGLQFWIDQIDAGRAFNTIAADFAASPEAEALYPYLVTPGVSNPTVFITSIYENLFNRAPDAAGLSFWSGVLSAGTVSVADFIEAIINGAVDDPAEGTFDATTLSNKIEVSLDFADKTSNEPGFTYDAAAAAAAVAVLDGVTYDPATVVEGKLEVDEFLHPSTETFTLTTGVDSGPEFTGGTTDAVFNAHLGLGIDGLVGVQTLQGPDVLDGGEGFNVLNAELNGTGTTANPTISNIQQYNLTSFANLLGGHGELDLSRATGYEQLWNRDSRVDLTLFNVGEAAIIGLDNVSNGSEYRVKYDNIGVETQVVVADHVGSDGAVTLDISGTLGGIDSLELNVSNGVDLYLERDAANISNLTIVGTDWLDLEANNDFQNLQTLDTLGYDGDVLLDVSGSGILESVLTGVGDDRIVVGAASVDGGLFVDLGEGQNTLAVDDVNYDGDVNGLDFTGGVQNVQTLELTDSIDLYNDATLDLDGFDGALTTVNFDGYLDGNGYTFGFDNAPETLTVNVAGSVWDVDLDTGNIVDLTMNVAGNTLDLDSVSGADLVNLTLNQLSAGGQIWLDMSGSDELSSLETLTVSGAGNADVDLEATTLGEDFDALTTVNVTAAYDATLNMDGWAGVAYYAGTQATQSFTINVTGGATFGLGGSQTNSAGNVWFTSSDIPGGVVQTNYNTTVGFFGGANSNFHDYGAADDVAAGLDALAELEASATGLTNTVSVTWADVGIVDPLAYLSAASGPTSGTLNSVTTGAFTQGTEMIAMVEGQGFEAVQTVEVHAQNGNADADLHDVMGAFVLDVTATDDADVHLYNTGATSATVDAGDTATVNIGGDTAGNHDLVSLTVTGDQANVTLDYDLGSFTTLDVSGVATYVLADTSGADFQVDPGQYVEYQIGATTDGNNATVDVDFTGNDIREVYNFVGADIGNVEVNDFTWGADPATGDRLDLSGFASNAGELVFTDNGGDLVITDLAGGLSDFDGSITIVGGAGHAADLASFNIIYG